MDAKILGRVQGALRGWWNASNDAPIQVNQHGYQLVAPGLPERTELARLGQSWWVKNTTAAAVVAGSPPTTTAGLSIQNPAASLVCLVVDYVSAVKIAGDATQEDALTLWVACGRNFTQVAVGTVAYGSYSGIKTYAGSAIAKDGATTVVADSPWLPLDTSAPFATAAAGALHKAQGKELNGRFIVVPGGAFHLVGTGVAATASALHYVIGWHEVKLEYV